MWVCHLVGIFESVFVINLCVIYTCVQRPICTPIPECPCSYLSFFLIFNICSPSRIADTALLAKRLVSASMCVKGRGMFYSVCVCIHSREHPSLTGGSFELSVLLCVYLSCSTCELLSQNRTEHRETRHTTQALRLTHSRYSVNIHFLPFHPRPLP